LLAFERLNEDRERQELSKFANPRNAAAGTIRVLEPNVVAQRRLDFTLTSFLSMESSTRSGMMTR